MSILTATPENLNVLTGLPDIDMDEGLREPVCPMNGKKGPRLFKEIARQAMERRHVSRGTGRSNWKALAHWFLHEYEAPEQLRTVVRAGGMDYVTVPLHDDSGKAERLTNKVARQIVSEYEDTW